jgi:hypothetical protein
MHDRGGLMRLQNERELAVTRDKLSRLEDRYRSTATGPSGDPHGRDLTPRSLKRLINQLKEEIARFEAQRVEPQSTSANA